MKKHTLIENLKNKAKGVLCAGAVALCAAAWSGPAHAFAAYDYAPWDWTPGLTESKPAVENQHQETPIGATGIRELGEALCAAGMNADADSLLNLLEPNSLAMLVEFTGAFDMDELEPGMDPLEMLKAEFRTEMESDPVTQCRVVETSRTDCEFQDFEEYTMMGMPAPDACGAVVIETRQASDDEPYTEELTGVALDGRWYAVFL